MRTDRQVGVYADCLSDIGGSDRLGRFDDLNWRIYVRNFANLNHMKPYPRQNLEEAAALSKTRIQIILRQVLNYKRILAIKFEKCFDQIDEVTADKILELIEKS